jgi:peptidoglycan pentaglycine glycine transferase (the first glycine)
MGRLAGGFSGGGHILQSYEWGEFKKRLGWRPIRLVLKRDGEVVGLAQFLAYDTGPFVPGALWYCTKGPWLPWDDEEAVRAFFRGVLEVAGREGAHTIKVEPEVLEEQDAKALLEGIGFRKARYDLNQKATMLVDLDLSEEELLRRMKATRRATTSALLTGRVLRWSSLTSKRHGRLSTVS